MLKGHVSAVTSAGFSEDGALMIRLGSGVVVAGWQMLFKKHCIPIAAQSVHNVLCVFKYTSCIHVK